MEPWILITFNERLVLYRTQIITMQVDKGWIIVLAHPKFTPTLNLDSPKIMLTMKNGR